MATQSWVNLMHTSLRKNKDKLAKTIVAEKTH